MKQLYNYSAGLVDKGELPQQELAETKKYIKDVLKDYKEQIKRIENDANSKKLNNSIYGELNFNTLTKLADDFLATM